MCLLGDIPFNPLYLLNKIENTKEEGVWERVTGFSLERVDVSVGYTGGNVQKL